MKILFELETGEYVVEVVKERLYARLSPTSVTPIYDAKFSPLLAIAIGKFHEYKQSDKMLFNKLSRIIEKDLKGTTDEDL